MMYNSALYRRSRASYILQCMFEYLVQLLAADAFLAKLLTSLGLSDSLTGIVTTLVSSAFLTELLVVPMMRRIKNVKFTVIAIDALSITSFALAYALPLFNLSQTLNSVLAFVFIGGGFILKYMIISMYYVWSGSFIEPTKRARYSSLNEIFSLIMGMIFSLVAARLFDSYEQAGNLNGCFKLISIIIICVNICSITCLMMIGNVRLPSQGKTDMRLVLKATLGNHRFIRAIILICLLRLSEYITVGFLGTYKTGELGYTVTQIQLINIAGCAAWALTSMPFAIYSDKTSFVKGIKSASVFAAVAFAVNCFTTSSTRWLIIVYTVLYNIAVSGTGQNAFNIAYSYVDKEYMTQAMAIKDSISGIMALIASIIGGRILALVQAHNNMLFGIHICGQQVLSGISCVMIIVTILYAKFAVEKLPVDKK